MLDLTIPDRLVDALAQLRDLSDEETAGVMAALSNKPLETFDSLERGIQEVIHDEAKAHGLGLALLNLVHLQRAHLATPDELHQAVRVAVQRRAPHKRWTEAQTDKWDQIASRIAAFLSLDALLVLEKLLDLRYNHENVLTRARLITELQPVFGAGVHQVRTFLVGHTLRVEFMRAGRPETLSLALDDRDVELLRRECERAIEKAATVRRELSAASLPVAEQK